MFFHPGESTARSVGILHKAMHRGEVALAKAPGLTMVSPAPPHEGKLIVNEAGIQAGHKGTGYGREEDQACGTMGQAPKPLQLGHVPLGKCKQKSEVTPSGF
jgi:hypothetical protein